MRKKAHRRRLVNLPALLAGLTIVFWPALAGATCCCSHAEHHNAMEQSVVPVCVHCCSASSGAKLSSESSQSPPCDCAAGCRSSFAALLPPVSQTNTFTIVLLENSIETGGLLRCCLERLDHRDASLTTSLSAQDHCARICSWLK